MLFVTECIRVPRFLSSLDAASMNLCPSAFLSFFLSNGLSTSSVLVPVRRRLFGQCFCVNRLQHLVRLHFFLAFT